MEILWLIGLFGFSTVATIFAMLQFAVGEPTGRHSRFNPGAIPARQLTGLSGAHREIKRAPLYVVALP